MAMDGMAAENGGADEAAQVANGECGARDEAAEPRGGRLLDALKRVPKAALRSVLGKDLGGRAWREARGRTASGGARDISDREIVEGLIGHLSRTAARTLTKEGRMARSIRLCATYADGYVSEGWRRLSGLTQDAGEIFEESRMVYEEWPHRAVPAVHLELRVGSVAAEAEAERAEARFGIAGAVGAA